MSRPTPICRRLNNNHCPNNAQTKAFGALPEENLRILLSIKLVEIKSGLLEGPTAILLKDVKPTGFGAVGNYGESETNRVNAVANRFGNDYAA